MSTYTGGSAFPNKDLPYSTDDEKGMTLRDYFAAKAMQGLIASNDGEAGDRLLEIPGYAYLIADKMLEARSL